MGKKLQKLSEAPPSPPQATMLLPAAAEVIPMAIYSLCPRRMRPNRSERQDDVDPANWTALTDFLDEKVPQWADGVKASPLWSCRAPYLVHYTCT